MFPSLPPPSEPTPPPPPTTPYVLPLSGERKSFSGDNLPDPFAKKCHWDPFKTPPPLPLRFSCSISIPSKFTCWPSILNDFCPILIPSKFTCRASILNDFRSGFPSLLLFQFFKAFQSPIHPVYMFLRLMSSNSSHGFHITRALGDWKNRVKLWAPGSF
jgi:hypothetical protein